MIRDRLQTSLLDEAHNTIAHLTVENRRLSETVANLEEELEIVKARLAKAECSRSSDMAGPHVGELASHLSDSVSAAHQILLLQQQLVEKESRLQVIEAQNRSLTDNISTLESMLQEKRRAEAAAAASPSPPARIPHDTPIGTSTRGEPSDGLVSQVRRLQEEARHARESERNYARMVDALQQELLFTQRQLMKGRTAHRHSPSSQLTAHEAPPTGPSQSPSLTSSLVPALRRECQANADALASLERAVSILQERCAAALHWDAEIITHLRRHLEGESR